MRPDGTVATSLSDIVVPAGTSARKLTQHDVRLREPQRQCRRREISSVLPVEVVDSIGKSHVVTMTFTKAAAAGEWTMQASIPGEETSASGAYGGHTVQPAHDTDRCQVRRRQAMITTPAAVPAASKSDYPSLKAAQTITAR